jgi:hypothetical protein
VVERIRADDIVEEIVLERQFSGVRLVEMDVFETGGFFSAAFIMLAEISMP